MAVRGWRKIHPAVTQVLSWFSQMKIVSAHTPHLGTQGKTFEEKLLVRCCGYSANTSTEHPSMKSLRFTCWPQKSKIPLRRQITADENLVPSHCLLSATFLYTQLMPAHYMPHSHHHHPLINVIKHTEYPNIPASMQSIPALWQSNTLISNKWICGGGCSLDKPHPHQPTSHPFKYLLNKQ